MSGPGPARGTASVSRAGLLGARVRVLPAALRRAFDELPGEVARARISPGGVRGVVATGAGSSSAHARFLASVLGERGVSARVLPLTSFLDDRRPIASPDEVVVVFSQGLSPNARIALRERAEGGRCWLVTATDDRDVGAPGSGSSAGEDAAATTSSSSVERRAALRELRERGVAVVRTPGADEFGTLMRVVGPLVGYAAALAIADAFAPGSDFPGATPSISARWTEAACAAVEGARAKWQDARGSLVPADLAAPVGFLASGAHVERIANLPLKVLEGLLRPLPGAFDLLDFAHGPFQQGFDGRALLFACAREEAAGERELLARLRAMLVPGRHRLVELRSSLPGAWAVFEHEALANAFVVGEVERLGLDPETWPGRGADAALYGVDGSARAGEVVDGATRATFAPGPESSAGTGPAAGTERALPAALPAEADRAASGPAMIEEIAWPDVAARIARGGTVAILALGSTEQHGPHLPIGTDTRIADELARRLAARIPGAVVLPPLALGCAGEHMSFAGTLDLREETLAAILRDVAVSLERHGFERLFVFSAHGGNRAALDRAIPGVRAAAPNLRVGRGPGAEALGGLLACEGARHGVTVAASGRHAGELETSILLHLAPALVRTDRARAGLLLDEDAPDPFYPDLRERADDGTVGDPRDAAAARAGGYLDAWVEALLAAYRSPASWDRATDRRGAP
ncbi:creatininase family protein [bacterium]|nr:creatininase family protein [bacterium]